MLLTAASVFILYTPLCAQDAEQTQQQAADKKTVSETETPVKTKVLITDPFEKENASENSAAEKADIENKTEQSTPKVTSFGGNTVTVTENIVAKRQEKGRWITVTNWDGAKWTSKRVWQPEKSMANPANKTIAGDGKSDTDKP